MTQSGAAALAWARTKPFWASLISWCLRCIFMPDKYGGSVSWDHRLARVPRRNRYNLISFPKFNPNNIADALEATAIMSVLILILPSEIGVPHTLGVLGSSE